MRFIAPAFLCLLLSTVAFSQEKLNIKFGKITPADFEVNSPLIDSNTNAIVLADIGNTEFDGNFRDWFTLLFTRHKRVKILNNKGFDAASFSIYLFAQNNKVEKLTEIKAQTYNLENNNIVTTKLSSKDIFEEKGRGNFIIKKFTFPGVKAGSIIDLEYTITSGFLFNLQPWEFQSEYPCLWSEYNVALPDFFVYVILGQGYLPYDINTTKKGFGNFNAQNATSVSNNFINSEVSNKKWIIKNVPPIKEESFTSTIANHISKIEFQLSEYRFPYQASQPVMESWSKVADRMMGSNDFGLAFTRSNDWLTDDVKKITSNAKTETEAAKSIYEYIRDNFSSTGNYGLYLSDNTTLKDIFKRKSGRSCEINLLLLAMLRHKNITCKPVILSLRNRGTVHSVYPLMDRFNYLIAEVQIEDKKLYLDASKPMLGFNQLAGECYNGIAWSITKEIQEPVYFYADSVKESNYTTILLSSEKEGEIKGTFSEELGSNTSLTIREKIKKTNLTAITNEIRKSLSGDIKVSNLSIDSLNFYDEPVTLKYDLAMNTETDIIYLNPMFGEAIQKNPFSSVKRNYPIEMPYLKDDHFVLNMEIPAGYIVEEMPKSVRYKLNEDEGMFEYLIANRDGRIQIRSSIKLNKANFAMDDYEGLREFYAFIIKQQNEQIVLKKAK